MSRLVTVLLATVMAFAGGAHVANAVPAASTLVLLPDGSTATTSFSTVAGEPYVVTVSGVYTYNGGGHLADCGWWQPQATGVWTQGGFLDIDGSQAPCSQQAYSAAHTYQFTVTGTGQPFGFRVWDAGYADNVGAFSITVVGARARIGHTVTSYCFPHVFFSTPTLDYTPVLVEAGAQAIESVPAIATFVNCTVSSSSGESLDLRLGVPGPVVATADRMIVPHGDWLSICSYGSATWDDGEELTTSPWCYSVRVP